jgi:hypothetical protein
MLEREEKEEGRRERRKMSEGEGKEGIVGQGAYLASLMRR